MTYLMLTPRLTRAHLAAAKIWGNQHRSIKIYACITMTALFKASFLIQIARRLLQIGCMSYRWDQRLLFACTPLRAALHLSQSLDYRTHAQRAAVTYYHAAVMWGMRTSEEERRGRGR